MSRFILVRDADTGTAQLIEDGVTRWSSDNDPELLETLGTDALRDADIGDVLEHLVSLDLLTEEEANEIPVDSPEDDDDDDDGFDDDDDDDDDDDEEDDEEAAA